MPKHHRPSYLLATMFFGAAMTAAQSTPAGPSVLAVQKSYHLGVYAAQIDQPSGDVLLLAQYGSFDLATNLTIQGAADLYEFSATSTTITPNDPFGGTYHVAPDGEMTFDRDPTNPGTDLLDLWIAADASVLHATRKDLDIEAGGILAIEKSTGQGNGALAGTWHVYGHYMELAGAGMQTRSGRGTVTFDGVGGLTFSITELQVQSNGTASTSTMSGSASYSVAADGAIVIDGDPGAVSADGQLLFAVTAQPASGEVGMLIAVRAGSTYDHNDLVGRYGFQGLSHTLGALPVLPRSRTAYGELALAAQSPTAGAGAIAERVVHNNSQGSSVGVLARTVATTLAGNGVMALTDANGTLELAFAANGRYCVGRAVGNDTSLYFGMKQCLASGAYGTATAGSGGIAPALGMRTFPTLGNSGFRFAIVDGRGGAAAIMPIGFAAPPAGVPLLGGLLWLDPALVVATPFVTLGGAVGTPGAGSVDLGLPIPSHPSFVGVQLFAQALVLDPGAVGGVAMSRGFVVRFCD